MPWPQVLYEIHPIMRGRQKHLNEAVEQGRGNMVRDFFFSFLGFNLHILRSARNSGECAAAV